MKKKYLKPEMCIVKVDGTNMIANSPVSQVSGNAGFTYGGGSSNAGATPAARVKDATEAYDVWQDDWSAE